MFTTVIHDPNRKPSKIVLIVVIACASIGVGCNIAATAADGWFSYPVYFDDSEDNPKLLEAFQSWLESGKCRFSYSNFIFNHVEASTIWAKCSKERVKKLLYQQATKANEKATNATIENRVINAVAGAFGNAVTSFLDIVKPPPRAPASEYFGDVKKSRDLECPLRDGDDEEITDCHPLYLVRNIKRQLCLKHNITVCIYEQHEQYNVTYDTDIITLKIFLKAKKLCDKETEDEEETDEDGASAEMGCDPGDSGTNEPFFYMIFGSVASGVSWILVVKSGCSRHGRLGTTQLAICAIAFLAAVVCTSIAIAKISSLRFEMDYGEGINLAIVSITFNLLSGIILLITRRSLTKKEEQ